MSLIAGNTSSGTAEETVANAGAHLKGRIFAAGASLALSLAFLVGGFSLAFGQDELVAASLAMGSFLVVTVLAFFGEVIVEPSLERVAQQREERRIQEEAESLPSAGGLLGSRLILTGSADADHPNVQNARLPETTAGAIGAPKGRRLDITLPEEHHAPPSRPPSGTVGGPTPAGSAAGTSEGDFQDLASLLKESSQPSPIPARQKP